MFEYAKKILAAAEEGKVIERRVVGFEGLPCWKVCSYIWTYSFDALNHPDAFRIKPEPKLVPYTFATWPKNALWLATHNARHVIVRVHEGGFDLNRVQWTFQDLLKPENAKSYWLISVAGLNLPSGVEVEG